MSEIGKLLQESQNPQERLMAETRGLVSKWEKRRNLRYASL